MRLKNNNYIIEKNKQFANMQRCTAGTKSLVDNRKIYSKLSWCYYIGNIIYFINL